MEHTRGIKKQEGKQENRLWNSCEQFRNEINEKKKKKKKLDS